MVDGNEPTLQITEASCENVRVGKLLCKLPKEKHKQQPSHKSSRLQSSLPAKHARSVVAQNLWE